MKIYCFLLFFIVLFAENARSQSNLEIEIIPFQLDTAWVFSDYNKKVLLNDKYRAVSPVKNGFICEGFDNHFTLIKNNGKIVVKSPYYYGVSRSPIGNLITVKKPHVFKSEYLIYSEDLNRIGDSSIHHSLRPIKEKEEYIFFSVESMNNRFGLGFTSPGTREKITMLTEFSYNSVIKNSKDGIRLVSDSFFLDYRIDLLTEVPTMELVSRYDRSNRKETIILENQLLEDHETVQPFDLRIKIDSNRNEIVEITYKVFKGNRFSFRVEDTLRINKFGIKSLKDLCVNKNLFTKRSNSFAEFKGKSGKKGVIDFNGNIIIDPKYDDILNVFVVNSKEYNDIFFLVKSLNKYHILNDESIALFESDLQLAPVIYPIESVDESIDLYFETIDTLDSRILFNKSGDTYFPQSVKRIFRYSNFKPLLALTDSEEIACVDYENFVLLPKKYLLKETFLTIKGRPIYYLTTKEKELPNIFMNESGVIYSNFR